MLIKDSENGIDCNFVTMETFADISCDNKLQLLSFYLQIIIPVTLPKKKINTKKNRKLASHICINI